ncbi:MAG: DoxX family membrane protein [Actinomycetota bacterium]|nr:DoxX family membrane protein [Actinomycetota bacterium]MDA3014789.1 DoxX family membrane protein [Actinomycetota bacterium]
MTSPRPRLAIALGLGISAAGVMHFVSPEFFDEIVPPWLPPSERFWTYLSGVAELVVGVMLFVPRWRRQGAIALIVLLIAVYPANLYMTWDWRDRSVSEQVVSWVRLPLQFVLIAMARAASRPIRPHSNSAHS